MIQILCQVPQHNKEIIEYYCFSKFCKERRLICYKCLQQANHKDHNVLRLSKLNEQTSEFHEKCQQIINNLSNLKQQLDNCIDELVKNLQGKFQQQPNNLSKFTYELLQSYLLGLLNFDENKVMIENDVIFSINYTKINIDNAIDKLEVKASLHYQTPPEMQQKVKDLQNQVTKLSQNNNIKEAYEIMNETLILDPNNTISLVMKGNLLLSQTKNYEAQTIFEKVLKIDPNNLEANTGLGDSLRGKNQYPDALKYYEKTLELDQNNKQALIGKAHCLGKDKKFQEATELIETILKKDRNDIDAIWGLADLLRIKGNDDNAINLYDLVLQSNPNHFESISGKGDCYRLLEKYDDAMRCLEKAQQINPNHVLTLSRIGDCLRQQKKFQQAMNYYNQALRLDPHDNWSLTQLNECKKKMQVLVYTEYQPRRCRKY